jgi:hypothetical protein
MIGHVGSYERRCIMLMHMVEVVDGGLGDVRDPHPVLLETVVVCAFH